MPPSAPGRLIVLALALGLLAACGRPQPTILRLATTTSTDDSGLLAAILPDFEEQVHARVDVVAVGTGQALELGRRGDVDVVLVHSPAQEEAFVAEGYGLARYDVMYNDFVIVGPAADPAGIRGLASAAEAFARLAAAQAPFAFRGDNSGTHNKELALWQAGGLEPDAQSDWYFSLGQGMGETLQFSNERLAYTLSDRGTFLAQAANLPNLVVLLGGQTISENPDPALYNPYGVIPVNPQRHPGTNADLAQKFVDWLTSFATQEAIGRFGLEQYGQPLFYPNSEAHRAAHP
ncbi:MAG: substrate-binding domain-containing protein [Chloroflexota bacterium]